MKGQYLNAKLECPTCGTIRLDIPDEPQEHTPITCSSCGRLLGTWGEMQDDFARQSQAGAFDLKDGRIREKR